MKNFFLRHHVWINSALIIAAAFAVFSNNYRHDYPLDCGHLLLENSYVRSLKYIPQYFVDARTLTSLPANADYRPVLQVTYALNYAISAYDTWSWHLVQILLHIVCGIGLYFLCRRILKEFHPEAGALETVAVPLAISLLFTVHPTASGVVNYLSARSSLLTAAFLLPSFVLYMKPVYRESKTVPLLPAVLYACALFSKIEAIGALAVYFLWEVALAAKNRSTDAGLAGKSGAGFLHDALSVIKGRLVKKLWVFAVITALYMVLYIKAMSGYHQAARYAADMSSSSYFFTQITAWWHYVFIWFAPVKLIADDLTYPIFRSLLAPEVLLAIAGWVVAGGLLAWLYPRYAYLAFLAVSALALISPTSTVMPLAEMVNEHRPYLPLALLSVTWLVPAGLFTFRMARSSKPAALITGAGFFLLCVAFFMLTFQRNKVFANEQAYYLDIIKKAPSSRSYVNYGLTLMEQGRYEEAKKYYLMALDLAPNWHIVHVNLGILYDHQGDNQRAQYHFDRAVATEQYSAVSLVYRAEFRLKQGQYAQALQDLEKSVPLTREFFRVYKAMACAYAGLGVWDKSLDYTKRCLELSPQQTELEIVGISRPFWESPARYQAGILYYQGLDQLLPRRWWVHHNIGDLASKLGQTDLAHKAFEESKKLPR